MLNQACVEFLSAETESIMSLRLTILPGLLAVAACAAAPESIQATFVPETPFLAMSCEQLGAEQARLAMSLQQNSTQQRNARTNDTLGVLFVGLPLSSMSGSNVAGTIAQQRGMQEAMQRVAVQKNCGAPVRR